MYGKNLKKVVEPMEVYPIYWHLEWCKPLEVLLLSLIYTSSAYVPKKSEQSQNSSYI